MSGRVSVLLSDGRRVTGYRKTLRVATKRTPQHMLPDWKLSFVLPPALGFTLPTGPYPGIIGVRIGELGLVTIAGKSRDWVIGQSAKFWSQVCRRHAVREIDAVLTRADEPGPTLSGPIRKGATTTCRLKFDDLGAVVIWGSTMRRVSYPVPMRW